MRQTMLLLSMLFASVVGWAQNYGHFVIYSGSNYMAHEKVGGEWKVTAKTTLGPECIWLSNTNNYCFVDTENSHNDTLYLYAEFGPSQLLKLGALPNSEQLAMNAVGVDSINVHRYYFYNWDKGLALGRQTCSISSDPDCVSDCPSWYNNTNNKECWQCYWVVYENSTWKMTSASSYEMPAQHSPIFRRVKVTEHPVGVKGYSGGILQLADFSMTNDGAGDPSDPSVTYTPYVDTIQPAYTTYLVSDLVCSGSWPDETCDTSWTVHNYWGGSDHSSATPAVVIYSSHAVPGDANYHWNISGPGAQYISFHNAKELLDTMVVHPRIHFRTPLTSGDITATLTLTVQYETGATQTRTCTITLHSECGNPRSWVKTVDYAGVTIEWMPVSNSTTGHYYQIRYKADNDAVVDWEETISIDEDVTQYTFTGLEPNEKYLYQIGGICGDATAPVWEDGSGNALADTVHFTTFRASKLQIVGAIFGGGRMADVDGNSNIYVANCDTISAIYGGNDIAGEVKGNSGSTIVVGIKSGDYDMNKYGVTTTEDTMHIGSIYGGGNGYYVYNGVNPGPTVTTTAFTSFAEVGGSTPYTLSGTIPTIKKTSITVGNNSVKLDTVFGGAKNAFILNGSGNSTDITVNGGTIYALFGGNNYGGTIADNSVQKVTVIMTLTDTTSDINNGTRHGFGRDFGIRYLYGGGKKVESPASDIAINGGQIDTLFVGGDNASVGAGTINVNCNFSSTTEDRVAWGNTLTRSVYSISSGISGESITIDNTYPWDNKGTYNIRCLYGGNNLAAMNTVPAITLTAGGIGTVYGGGNAGAMTYDGEPTNTKTTIDANEVYYSTHINTNSNHIFIDKLYGGCNQSDVVRSTWVELDNGYLGYVFGGCNVSGDVGSTRTDLAAEARTPGYYAVKGGCWVDMKGGHVYKNLYGGSDGFYHCNDEVFYTAGINYTEHNYVGMRIPTHNETHVVISGGTVHGNAYAGGNLANVGFPTDGIDISYWTGTRKFPMISGMASIHMTGGKIVRNAFGGGNMASIYGINDVLVEGGQIDGALYGGNDRAGRVRKFDLRSPAVQVASDGVTPKGDITTYVKVTGTANVNTVFGGGNGDYDYTENSDVPLCGNPDLIKPIQTGSFVDINIADDPDAANRGYVGTVYGGGDGVYVNGSITVFLNVDKGSNANYSGVDNVGTIFGGNNLGNLTCVPDIIMLHGQVHDVYGGSNKGNMNGFVEHNIGGVPEVGSYVHLRKSYKATPASALVTPDATVTGSVYGGCRISNVAHNSLVLVEGGNHTEADIFGGNDIGGTIVGGSYVVIDSTAIVDKVYGGGNGLYRYNAHDGVIETYDGSRILETATNLSRPFSTVADVKLKGGDCEGNVYAGGLAGDCGSTNLTVEGSTVIKGNLFGGGCGIVDSIGVGSGCSGLVTHQHVGNVTGTSTTTLHSMKAEGSTMKRVYGGGHNGNCGNTVVNLLPSFRYSINHLYGGCVAGYIPGTVQITVGNKDDGIHTTVDTLYGGNDFTGLVGTTVITIDSGRFHNVFGGGNGRYKYGTWLASKGLASSSICIDTVPYSMNVTVNFNGGYYEGNVYGGGNLGLVGNRDMTPASMTTATALATRNDNIGQITVNIHSPAFFNRHVFAGAKGFSDMKRTFFSGNTFSTGVSGAAVGRNADNTNPLGKQLVYGQKIVNMDGGTINFSLYGGSESVDDGYPYECIGNKDVYYYKNSRLSTPVRGDHNSTMRPSSVINIVGGNVRKNIYGSGYQGNAYGSAYVNIGRRAVNESPVWTNDYGGYSMAAFKPVLIGSNATRTDPGQLRMGEDVILEASVYNGSDWGEAGDKAYFNTRGFYGGETNILVDGDGYYTSAGDPDAELRMPSMSIYFSLMGSGISTEGGDVNRLITMHRYGNYYDCNGFSRELFSIQRADKVVLDSVFLVLKGEQDAFSAYTSTNYSFCRIDTLIFLGDNVITIEAPGNYVGNMVSMKRGADGTLTQIGVPANLFDNTPVTGGDGDSEVANDMLDHLQTMSANNSCDGTTTLNNNCDALDFCDRLPLMRGTAGYSGNYNTLVMRNGSYVRVSSFVDDHNNNNTTILIPDGKDDDITYGHVKGWMYLVSEDRTQSYIYAADKSTSLNPNDGGFVGLCACENVNPFTNFSNELNYDRITNEYRSWRVGTYQGRRTRSVTLVANADPDSVLNWYMPKSGHLHINTDNGTLVDTTNHTDPVYTISESNGNTNLGYATALLELPPSEPGNFYVINEIIVDQDNGYQMQLTEQVYDHATNTIFNPSSLGSSITTLANIHDAPQEDRNKTFALAFSTQFDGSNFDQSSCWNSTSTLDQTLGPDEEHQRQLTESGGARKFCWPISGISGNSYWSSVNGFLSRSVAGAGGVVPSIMFTLTYDTRLSNTLTRDVVFVIDEYDSQGNFVGPINVTVTISTVLKKFTNMEATVMAMYNEGVNNDYLRKVTIPSSFVERDLWLTGIEWDNNVANYESEPITTATTVSNEACNSDTRPYSDLFYMRPVGTPIEETLVADATRQDDGKTYCGNNLFSLTVSPSESSSESTNNHLAWVDINNAARNLDVYKTALDDYKETMNASTSSAYGDNWDFTNGDLAQYNKIRKYSSLNYTDEALEADQLKTKLATDNRILIGTLDGRSTASLELNLHYNGDYVYPEYYKNPHLGTVKLHFYWENTKYKNSESEAVSTDDHGEMTLTINLRTRKQGDTIYLAPEHTLTRTPEGSTTPLTMHSWESQNPGVAFSPSKRDDVINKPNSYVRNLKHAMMAYIEGDVLDIMETIPVGSSSEAATVHGEDYSIIQIIRYSGSHYQFPTEGCAHTGPMLDVKQNGKLYLRNVWVNGSGCTRLKKTTASGGDGISESSKRVPGFVYSEAPAILCHNSGEVNMSYNVLVSNNFNFGKDSVLNSAGNEWIANTSNKYSRGGGIAVIRDLATGDDPKLILGNKCRLFDNAVVDWKAETDNFKTLNPTDPRPALTYPQNYGGAVYLNGGIMQIGSSSTADNSIDISRNFYFTDTSTNTSTRQREKIVKGIKEYFLVNYLDTVRHPQSFTLSNVHLTRTTSNDPNFWPAPGSVRRDVISDKISFVSDFSDDSRVGVNKWFPGYKYNNSSSHLNNSDPRDTICIAVDRSNKARVAEQNFASGLFFNDSSYYYDNSHYQATNYNSNPDDSLAARFVPIAKDYTAYHNNSTRYPSYNDQVWELYSPSISKTNFYLQRCSSFGAGVTQTVDTHTETINGRPVTLTINNYISGDSIFYKWDHNASCVASTDTIYTNFGGGFFPYTYKWYRDDFIDETADYAIMNRTLVRNRTTAGNNSISTINNSAGTVNTRNAMLRKRASRDTMVLTTLEQAENHARSTYFYTLVANDATGRCAVNLPVMIRAVKMVTDYESSHDHGVHYFVDSANFLRHRNPYASYPYYNTEPGQVSYYEDYPASGDAGGIRYDDPAHTTTPAANLFSQYTKDGKYYWAAYGAEYEAFMKVVTTTDPGSDPSKPYLGPMVDGKQSYALADYYYYRIAGPGVDSSSFHDKVAVGTVGSETVFFNSLGDTLYPYIMEGSSSARQDTMGYEIVKHRGGAENRYRVNAAHDQVTVWDGSSWTTPSSSDSYVPQPDDFWPKRNLPYHLHGEVSAEIGSRGGIRRAGYSHVPMHWFNHGYNRGTLEERLKAESFSGMPYHDDIHMIPKTWYYPDGNTANPRISSDSIPDNLYQSEMVPRYLRVFRAYHIMPSIYPADADSVVRAYPPDVTDFASAAPLDLNTAEFCPGDIVKLVPIAKQKSQRWPGQRPGWRYTAWDYDASSDSIATFVVSAINTLADTLRNRPVAYFAPGQYWWQHVTSLPAASYIRHNNGDVTIKDSTGLAWLISTVNGYNGQNARNFHNNKVFFDFDSVNMSRYLWTPVGNRNNHFEGEIVVSSGKKGIITGVTVNEKTLPLVGMFGYTKNAKLNGFSLDSIMLNGTASVGGVVAYADTNTEVKYISMGNGHLFGQQYTGGVAAQAYRASFISDTIKSVAIRGNAVVAGGLVGVMTSSTHRNTSVVTDMRNLSAIYLGGLSGRIQRDTPNGKGDKSTIPSYVENNYVHLTADGTSRRVGGLVGSAEGLELNNSYVYGSASGSNYVGGIVGYVGSDVNISNCYYQYGMSKGIWGYNTHPAAVKKSTTFTGSGMNVLLTERVDGYSNMLRALNRWVFTHGGDSIYSTWRSTEPDENNGYPVFGDPEMITVLDSVDQTTCDELEWDGLLFTESGRYIFHVVDSADYLDSTFILHLTVNYSDSTVVSDSVTLGQPYQGYGLNISAEELSRLFGNDRSREVVALHYVDSLLTAQGCDSLVVVTLYVVNGNVDINSQVSTLNTQLKIYPNPTRGKVNVEGEGLKSVEVYDNISRRVLQYSGFTEGNDSKYVFDLSNQAAGSYYIRVRTASGTVVKKLIKK